MVGKVEEVTLLPLPPDWEMLEAQEPRPPTPTLPFYPSQDRHMKIEQLEVQEGEEEEEDGPPPWWNIIPQLQTNTGNENMDDGDDEGPPPGWDFTPKREQLSGHENKGIEEERQPTGWHFVSLPESERQNDHQDIEEDGPPSGWPSMPPTKQNDMIVKKEIDMGNEIGSHALPSPQIRVRSELEAVEAKEIGIKHEKSSIDLLQPIVEYKQDNDGAQPAMNSTLLPQPQVPSPMAPSPLQISGIHMKIEQLEVQEEEEEEEDGPPPGWNIIPQLQTNTGNENMDDGDDEGPPPGWDFTPKREQLSGHENKRIEEERQPTGWHFVSLPESERQNDHQDIEEDGPPPGWPSMPPTKQNDMIVKKEIDVGNEIGSHALPSPQIRVRSELEAVEAKEIGIKHEKSSIDLLQPIVEYKQDNDGAQPVMNSILLPQPQVPFPMAPSPLQISDTDLKSGQEVADEEGPPPGWHSVEPNKTSGEHQDIKEGVSCGWTSPAKRKTELQKDMIIERAEEEGPPPGWNSIGKNNIDCEYQDIKEGVSCGWTSPAKLKTELQTDMIIEEGEEEGPPPGWNLIRENNIVSEHQDVKEGESSAKSKTELENQDILEEGADEEGPPPGWYSTEKDKISSEHQDIKGASHALTSPEKPRTEPEEQDTIDEGPPPGWNHVPLMQSKTGSEHQAIKSERPSHGLHLDPPPQPKLDSIKKEIGEKMHQSTSNSVCQQPKIRHGQQEVKEERSQPGSSSMPPPSPQIQSPMLTTTPMSTASRIPTQSGSHLEMGQMVCGSCRRLLSYALGAKYVICSCCQTVNLVLEAHQVGQVKCGGCEVLLMYQFGANAVQCASCRHVTEIVAQNRRPPLSVQQAHGRRHGISKR